MKLFGEYLVEKGLIPSDVLVRALVEQLKGLPSPAEVVFEKQLFSNERLLSVFRCQIEKKCSFVEAAVMLKFWNEKLSCQIEDHVASVRVPLGQVLIKFGALSLEQITHALDEFLGEIEVAADFSNSATISPAPHGGPYAAFCDLFTPSLRTKLDALFTADSQKLADAAIVRQVKDEIHRVKGAARLVSATESDQLLGSLENLLDVVLGLDMPALTSDLLKKLKEVYQKFVNLLWRAQAQLQSAQSEIEGLASIKTEFDNTNDQIQVLCFDLGFATPAAAPSATGKS